MVNPVDRMEKEEISPKSRLTTALLAALLGEFGAHRFYIGKPGTAIMMLLLGVSGLAILPFSRLGFLFLIPVVVWTLIDFLDIEAGNMRDGKGRLIKNW